MKAFEVLYCRYVPKLLAFLKSFYATDYQSAEIVQEIFIKIWERRDHLKEDLSFSSYLFQAAKNRIYNSSRDKIKELKFYDSFSFQSNDKSRNFIEEYIDFKELQEHSINAIHKLPPVQKKIFLLSRNNGLTNNEIATKLKLSKRTVEQHIYRALKQLKKSVLIDHIYYLIILLLY